MPIRLIGIDASGGVSLQVLDGRHNGDPDNTLPVALVHAYTPRVAQRNGSNGAETALWRDLASIGGGTPVAALVDQSCKPRTKQRPNGSTFVAFHYREASKVVSPDQASTLHPTQGQILIFGYLHRTGPNIENKHHERLFLCWASYNDPKSTLPIAERFEAFQKDDQPQIRADTSVVKAAEAGLRNYRERHERKARQVGDPPRGIKDGAPFPSDFVDAKHSPRIQPGDLFYALLEGNEVRGLYPVALPRLSYDYSRGNLLHSDFHPCTDHQELCPACRVFGWVRPAEGKLTPESQCRDAIASHVRFTHATLDGTWGTDDRKPRLATLAILESPKPTTTAFYLRPRENYAQARSNRWPPVLQKALYQILMYHDGMPKPLSSQTHLALPELETRYRRAKDPVVRSHWQVIWLLAQGWVSGQVAAITGYTVNWVRTIARRSNQQGAAGLEDRRHRNPGAGGLFTAAQRAALLAALEQPPPDGGVWTGPNAAAWMAATLGRRVHPQRGWEVLRRLGWTSKVPRPRHAKAEPAAQATVKKLSRPPSKRSNTPVRRIP